MHKNSFVGNFALFGRPRGGAESRRREVETLSLPHVVVVKVFLLRSGWVWGAGAATKNYAYAQLNPQQIPFLFVGICCCLFMCVHVCVCGHKIWMRRVRHTNAAYFLAHMNMQQQQQQQCAQSQQHLLSLFICLFLCSFIYLFIHLLYWFIRVPCGFCATLPAQLCMACQRWPLTFNTAAVK